MYIEIYNSTWGYILSLVSFFLKINQSLHQVLAVNMLYASCNMKLLSMPFVSAILKKCQNINRKSIRIVLPLSITEFPPTSLPYLWGYSTTSQVLLYQKVSEQSKWCAQLWLQKDTMRTNMMKMCHSTLVCQTVLRSAISELEGSTVWWYSSGLHCWCF